MVARGVEVHVVSSPGPALEAFAREHAVEAHAIPMRRAIAPGGDLHALRAMTSLLRRLDPTIVHAHTPKGGLLGMMAAAAARVPYRIYQLRGLPWITARGVTRRILWGTESTAFACAHVVVAVSHSLAQVAREARFVGAQRKLRVLGEGSGQGVDALGRFDPTHSPGRTAARQCWGLPPEVLVIGYVGRLVRDKGVPELVAAWRTLRRRLPEARLLVVGDADERDSVDDRWLARLEEDERVLHIRRTSEMPAVYAACDVFVLPTHREGFPNVLLEAASMELPVVATESVGCVDAVEDGVTGFLVAIGDVAALTTALERYLRDAELRTAHGRAGRARVLKHFERGDVIQRIGGLYDELLGDLRGR